MKDSTITKAIKQLKLGNVVLCPSDTVWGLSCDATNEEAVEKIYHIKGRSKKKSFIVLVSSIDMLKNYVGDISFDIEAICRKYNKPVSIIYPGAKNLANNTIAENGSIAIRVVKNGFVQELIERYGKPIVSSSANFSNEPTAHTFDEISEKLKLAVDYIVETNYNKTKAQASSILIIENNKIKLLRA